MTLRLRAGWRITGDKIAGATGADVKLRATTACQAANACGISANSTAFRRREDV